MLNRKIREFLNKGYNDKLILSVENISIKDINNNYEALTIISRYNRIVKNRQHNELLNKGYKCNPLFNMLGNYSGYYYTYQK